MATTLINSSSTSLDHGLYLYFEDDSPCFWFLIPLWDDLQSRTGFLVDLYDGSTCECDQLEEAFHTVTEFIQKTENQKLSNWLQETTIEVYPDVVQNEAILTKDEVIDTLSRLLELIKVCIEKSDSLISTGD